VACIFLFSIIPSLYAAVSVLALAPPDIPADGLLVLGSIILDLRDPDNLNKGAIVKIPQRDIHTIHGYDWEDTAESARGGCIGVCARYLSAFFGGNLGVNHGSPVLFPTLYNIS